MYRFGFKIVEQSVESMKVKSKKVSVFLLSLTFSHSNFSLTLTQIFLSLSLSLSMKAAGLMISSISPMDQHSAASRISSYLAGMNHNCSPSPRLSSTSTPTGGSGGDPRPFPSSLLSPSSPYYSADTHPALLAAAAQHYSASANQGSSSSFLLLFLPFLSVCSNPIC